MDLRGISNSHRRLKKVHDDVQFRSTNARDEHGNTEAGEMHHGFQITYQQKKIGLTRARTQYSVVVECAEPKVKLYLSGFSSLESAREAAKNRIDALLYRQQRHIHRTGNADTFAAE